MLIRIKTVSKYRCERPFLKVMGYTEGHFTHMIPLAGTESKIQLMGVSSSLSGYILGISQLIKTNNIMTASNGLDEWKIISGLKYCQQGYSGKYYMQMTRKQNIPLAIKRLSLISFQVSLE